MSRAGRASVRCQEVAGHVGGAAVYLLSDLGSSTTGDVLFVDGGYHAIGMAQLDNML